MFKKTSTLALAAFFLLSAGLFAAGSGEKKEKKEKKEMQEETASSGTEHYNAGVKLMKEGDCVAAAAKFEAAIAAEPSLAEAHNNLGYCLRKQGADHYAAALEHYGHALELNDKLAEAYHYRGVLHVLMGHEDKAKEDHAALLELDRELAAELMDAIATGKEPAGHGGAAGW